MSGGHQFNPPGQLLFRIPFNVDAADDAGFVRFIEGVVERLRNRIQLPRYNATATALVLPCPQAAQRTWFVIELQSRDRHMSYSVPIFIEAETICLRGYQNQYRDLFEFAGGNYLGGESTRLSFSCNYEDLEPSTEEKKQGGDPGLVLLQLPEPKQGSSKVVPRSIFGEKESSMKENSKEVPRPNFGKERLRVAVRELAQGRNLHGQSQHRTAQNLLLVIVRFCESIRFKSIRAEMAKLWDVQSGTGQPSDCLSKHHFGQIKNWNKLVIILEDRVSESIRRLFPQNPHRKLLADVTGVRSAAEAQTTLDLVSSQTYKNEDNKPKWISPPDNNNNNNNRLRYVYGSAAQLRVRPLERKEPVLRIMRVYVPRQPGLRGIYGTVTVDDGLGAQDIFRRSRTSYQSYSSGSKAQKTLSLKSLHRSVSAADSWCIDVDLWGRAGAASTDARLGTGRITWSIHDFSSNTYDQVMSKTIGQAVVEYVVRSSATATVRRLA